jgi:DNA-binding transcriptional LysR family regulator
VASPSYIENLKIRGVSQDAILTSSMLMLLDKENMTRKYIDDYLEENSIHVQDTIEISSMDLLIEFARIGLGVACVIKSFVQEDLNDGTLVEVPLEIPFHKREVGFAYRNNISHSKSLDKFVNFYKKTT